MKTQHEYLAQSITNERLKRGMSLTDLSRKSGVARGYLHLLEKGENSPTLKVLSKLADALQIPLPVLLTGVDGYALAGLSDDEYHLLHAWREGDTAQLLTMIAGRISEVHGE